jgi:hypothetical protein
MSPIGMRTLVNTRASMLLGHVRLAGLLTGKTSKLPQIDDIYGSARIRVSFATSPRFTWAS